MTSVNVRRYTRRVSVPSSNLDVIGLGENSIDRVLIVPRLPGAPDAPSKMRVDEALRSCGGQVATTLAACAALGLRASYAGAIGDDEDGRLVRETLVTRGVNVTHLHVASAATRSATILVEAGTGERTVLWNRDARLSITAAQVDAIDVASARVIHVDDTDIAASIRLARAARRAGRMVTTDIDASEHDVRELLTLATHPILSEHGLASLTGEHDPERGLRALRERCDGVLCVTLGARGAMALDGDILVTSPGVPVTAIDTTGAGDVFRAGFIRALLEGHSLSEILHFANAAAAISCTRVGAIDSVPMLDQVQELFNMEGHGGP